MGKPQGLIEHSLCGQCCAKACAQYEEVKSNSFKNFYVTWEEKSQMRCKDKPKRQGSKKTTSQKHTERKTQH